MLSLVKYLPLAIQGIAALLGVIYAVTACANAILSAVPLPWREAVVKRWPRSAHLATALRSGGAHLTAFLVAMLAFLRGLPVAPPSASEALASVPRQPAPPNSHGFAHIGVMQGITYIVIAAALALATHGCSGTQLERDMHAADDLGIVANRAEPVWMNAYRLDGQHAADAACTNTADAACVQLRLAAVEAVRARWMHVRQQWETAVADHDALSGCLEAAHRSDGGGICPDQAAKQAALTASMMTYRCTVHAIGHAELDPLGSNGLVCPGAVTDGGAL